MLTIAITLIAGAAVFGYVNSQAKVTESQYGASVGSTVNFLQERFIVMDMNFSSSKVTIWIYNNGQVALSPIQILLYSVGRSTYLLYNATKVVSYKPTSCSTAATTSNESPRLLWNAKTVTGLNVTIQGIQRVTLALPSCSGASFASGTTYTVNILGLYGNSVVYYQAR
jgi:hypothetical protein